MRDARYLVAIAAWLLAGCVSLWFASETKIGPTVVYVTTEHGLHRGDVLILLAGAAVASMITVAVFRLPRD